MAEEFNINADLKEALRLEGLQMASEVNSAALIIVNGKLDMIAKAMDLDISNPPLSDEDEANKIHLMKSVAKRLVRVVELSAMAMGLEKPSTEEATDQLFELAKQVFPNAQPPADEKDVAEAPEFPTDGSFEVYIFSDEEFANIDFTDPTAREQLADRIKDHYYAATDSAVSDGWLSLEWAKRIQQEMGAMVADTEVDSDLELPDPDEVSQGVAEAAARGETRIAIKGLAGQEEIIEALMTAFTVSMINAQIAMNAALLNARLAGLGMMVSD